MLTNCENCKYCNQGRMVMPCRSCCFGSNYEPKVEGPNFVYRFTHNPYNQARFDSYSLIRQLVEYECRRKANDMYKIKDVIFNDPATIILWKDGSKTVVKAQDEKFDPEKGMAMAICKKVMGNKGNFNDIFKKYIKPEVQTSPEDTTVNRIKALYHEGENTMADLIRLYYDLLTIVEKQELLKWAGEDDLLEVNCLGEIEVKPVNTGKKLSGLEILSDMNKHYPDTPSHVVKTKIKNENKIKVMLERNGVTEKYIYDYDTKQLTTDN